MLYLAFVLVCFCGPDQGGSAAAMNIASDACGKCIRRFKGLRVSRHPPPAKTASSYELGAWVRIASSYHTDDDGAGGGGAGFGGAPGVFGGAAGLLVGSKHTTTSTETDPAVRGARDAGDHEIESQTFAVLVLVLQNPGGHVAQRMEDRQIQNEAGTGKKPLVGSVVRGLRAEDLREIIMASADPDPEDGEGATFEQEEADAREVLLTNFRRKLVSSASGKFFPFLPGMKVRVLSSSVAGGGMGISRKLGDGNTAWNRKKAALGADNHARYLLPLDFAMRTKAEDRVSKLMSFEKEAQPGEDESATIWGQERELRAEMERQMRVDFDVGTVQIKGGTNLFSWWVRVAESDSDSGADGQKHKSLRGNAFHYHDFQLVRIVVGTGPTLFPLALFSPLVRRYAGYLAELIQYAENGLWVVRLRSDVAGNRLTDMPGNRLTGSFLQLLLPASALQVVTPLREILSPLRSLFGKNHLLGTLVGDGLAAVEKLVEVRWTVWRSRGLFALADIAAGSEIFSEFAVLWQEDDRQSVTVYVPGCAETFPVPKAPQEMLTAARILQLALEKNCYRMSGLSSAGHPTSLRHSVVQRNCWTLSGASCEKVPRKTIFAESSSERPTEKMALFLLGSMMNHCCESFNADPTFAMVREPDGTVQPVMTLIARPGFPTIKKGDEILVRRIRARTRAQHQHKRNRKRAA
eukprot:g14881.t1